MINSGACAPDSVTHAARADPPYTQNTQAAWGPLALKDVLILVLFFNLSSVYENMNDHFF